MTLPQYRGKVYTRETFLQRVASLKWQKGWRPGYIVQHSTGIPKLADVMKDPNNHLSRLLNMELDYEHRLHWQHTPHLFIFPPYPGQADGLILEMNDLEVRGTHSSCDNAHAIGVEHVGYYSPGHDEWNTGDGAKVRDLGVFAMSALYNALGVQPDPFALHQKGHHFHCMCIADGHSICPGIYVDRRDMVQRIQAEMAAQKAVKTGSRRVISRIARFLSKWSGSSAAIVASNIYVLLWLVAFNFGSFDVVSQVGNDIMTVVTFLIGFLILGTQNRDTAALHAKLDELIRVDKDARDELHRIEDKTEEEIENVRRASDP